MAILSRAVANMFPASPSGPEHVIRRYSPDLDVPISSTPDIPLKNTGVHEIDGGWRFRTTTPHVFGLFDADIRHVGRGMLTYRAEVRTRDAGTTAYLEVGFRIPGQGEFFVKGTHDAIDGARRWRTLELPVLFRVDHCPSVVSLNLTFDSPGVVEMRNIELVWQELSGPLELRQLPRTTLGIAWRLLRFVLLVTINAALIAPQLVIAVVFDWGEVFTWWPKKKSPTVGRYSG
jgi:hypothetical protein